MVLRQNFDSKLRCNHTTNVPHFQQWGLNFETAVKYELLFNVYKIYSCNVYKILQLIRS